MVVNNGLAHAEEGIIYAAHCKSNLSEGIFSHGLPAHVVMGAGIDHCDPQFIVTQKPQDAVIKFRNYRLCRNLH